MSRLYVVGIGAGSYDMLTVGAIKALGEAELICGYTGYVRLIRPYFPDKEYYETSMMQEIERCRFAVRSARDGRVTALICSGDAGVYGMASPVYETAGEDPPEIVAIPGVTAACSGAVLLGAPLTQDFAVISLRALLTPWEGNEARLRAAASADFCIAIYNPRSKKRSDDLSRAVKIIREYRPPDTVCDVVRNIGREEEKSALFPLCALTDEEADMFTTVFIGNSRTKIIKGRMVTPRGYRDV